MTAKSLSDEELREVCDHYTGPGVVRDDIRDLLATVRDRDATIRRRGELIAWLVSGDAIVAKSRDGKIAILSRSGTEQGNKNATEALAIVAGLEQ